MKKVAFMIGEDLEEDEIGEDAFHHDFGMQLQANDSDSDDFGVYSYDTQESLESVKSCLADRLETKVFWKLLFWFYGSTLTYFY